MIATVAIAASVAVMMTVAMMGRLPSLNQNAMAQSEDSDDAAQQANQIRRSLTYLTTETAPVPVNSNASAQALCQFGDVLLTGGYVIGGFDSPDQVFNTYLYSNTAFRIENATSTHEGWIAALANMGTTQLTITANAVCLDVTPQ